jgi:hypothetical protein
MLLTLYLNYINAYIKVKVQNLKQGNNIIIDYEHSKFKYLGI